MIVGDSALLDAWQAWLPDGFLQAGHLAAIGGDRGRLIENHFAAFTAAWAAARALERDAIIALLSEHGAEYLAEPRPCRCRRANCPVGEVRDRLPAADLVREQRR